MRSELLKAKGTIEGILSLDEKDEKVDLDTIAEEMDVSSSTARERIKSLNEEDVIDEDASIVDGKAKRVFSLTESGKDVAQNLADIIDDSVSQSAD